MDKTASTRVLGRLLFELGAITEPELHAGLQEQRRTRERIGEVLVRRGTDPELVARALATQLRLAYAEPPLRPERSALALIDRAVAERLRMVPLTTADRSLRIAAADPLDLAALDDLQFRTGRRVEPVVASAATIEQALSFYEHDTLSELVRRLPQRGGEADDLGALQRASEAPPVVALVEHVLRRAVGLGASDVHVEPRADRLLIRARVDGVLVPLVELPPVAIAPFVSRLKVMGKLDISVRRRPQDGRAHVRVQSRDYALRISTLPAQGGEKVVLRLLDPNNSGQSLQQTGLPPDELQRFRAMLGRGHGLLLVTGPTGSGKTTTLYAALAALDRSTRNVITLEDPVEYQLSGLTQVQVHKKAGLSFAAALRAVLRQDPDVIMIGELRDQETAEIALAAAVTGHLVLSTLHTNDAASTVTRLIELGVQPQLVAAALTGVVAQRLVRRLCSSCAQPREATLDETRLLHVSGSAPPRIREPIGCKACGGTGYRGRVGIFELLTASSRIRTLVLKNASADAIRAAARLEGMRSLLDDARARVLDGTTSFAEVQPFLLQEEDAALCSCGELLRAGFNVCPGCGRRLRSRCKCGMVLERDWTRCPRCAAPALSEPHPAAH